jgi:hypothetical protein
MFCFFKFYIWNKMNMKLQIWTASHPVLAKLVHILTTLVTVLFSSEPSSIGGLIRVLNKYPSSSAWETPESEKYNDTRQVSL